MTRHFKKIVILLTILILKPLFAQVGFQGWILDADTAEPLETAQVIVLDSDIGTVTDKSGYFNIILPETEFDIVLQMSGYQSDTINTKKLTKKSKQQYYYLERKPFEFNPVTVTEYINNNKNAPMALNLDIGIMSSRSVLGEVDVFRLIQNLPGVSYTNDFSGLLFIRGNNWDHNQITFDDVPILNPYHFGGAYSSFNAESVKQVEFVPGKYSAEHGGYLGGRINIVPKTGDENQAYPTKISLGLLSSKISTGKKFGNNSYFFSYRRSYLDLIEKMVSDNSSYYFADFHGGYKYQINNKNSISFHYYYSKDVFTNFLEKDEDEIKGLTQPFWGNKLYSFKWQYTNKLNIKILSHIYSSVSKAYSNTTHIDINNELKNYTWIEKFNLSINQHNLCTGFQFQLLDYDHSWNIQDSEELWNIVRPPESIFFDYAPSKFNFNNSTKTMSLFLQDEYKINSKLQFNSGLRFGWFELADYYYLIPSFQIIREFSNNKKIFITISQQEQYRYTLKSITNSDYFAPFSAYFFMKENQKPLSSLNFSTGYHWDIPELFLFRIEAYVKQMKNIPKKSEYSSHEIIYDKLKASGIDFYIDRYKQKGINISAAYSLSYINVLENNKQYPASYHRLHNLKLEVAYRSKKGIQMGFRGIYLSGLPYTPILGKFLGAGTDVDDGIYWRIKDPFSFSGALGLVRGEKNSQRFPSYHRIDFDISKMWTFEKSRLWLKLQVLNVLNKKNPIEYKWELYHDKSLKDDFLNLSTIPSIEVTYEF